MSAPLADRLRPQALDEIVGQKHLLGEGKPLRNIILSGELPNLVFYGPSGVGKTTLAGGNVSLAFGAWLDSFAPVVFASSPAPLQAAKESTKALAISREKSFVSFVFI